MELLIDKWNEIKELLKEEFELTPISFSTWVEPLEVFKVEDRTVYILIKSDNSSMTRNYIMKKYTSPLMAVIAEVTGKDYEIKYIIPEELDNYQKAEIPKENKSESKNNTYNKEATEKANLNHNYTFEKFVVGSNNRFAQSAALAVAESPGNAFNPLYIYGGPGLGKTHLMHSIGNYIIERQPSTKVLYVTSEEFTNEIVESIRNGNASAMNKIREKYRTVDVLMIDDIQFIIGKEATQDEFFHTFNALHSAGKQIIISSDKPPREMQSLEDRIKSRFEWGLMADIGYPDYETRMAILRRLAESEAINLDDEILNYIATNIKSNIRELEGAFNKLLAYAKIEKKEITIDVAINELQNIITPDKPREVTPQLIVEVVSEHFQLPINQMISKNRSSDYVRARQVAMYLCKQMTDIPLDSIGQLLGGRDHSTILHGINKMSDELETNETTRNMIETIQKKINPN
ncbi:MAG: chromosomal replication initiator protein DnaA [Lachnospiraceae bacterium]|nr:chromosomal replication initiator protein DnaA [Lachnospiraceae bacterium]